MKISKFKVAIYDWKVTILQIEDISDYIKYKDQITKVAKSNYLDKEGASDLLSDCHKLKGEASFYSCKSSQRALMVLFRDHSDIELINSVCHEKRHLEDYILSHAHIDNKEAAGYLAGYLASKIFPLLKYKTIKNTL